MELYEKVTFLYSLLLPLKWCTSDSALWLGNVSRSPLLVLSSGVRKLNLER